MFWSRNLPRAPDSVFRASWLGEKRFCRFSGRESGKWTRADRPAAPENPSPWIASLVALAVCSSFVKWALRGSRWSSTNRPRDGRTYTDGDQWATLGFDRPAHRLWNRLPAASHSMVPRRHAPAREISYRENVVCRRVVGELTHLSNLRAGRPQNWPAAYPNFWTSLVDDGRALASGHVLRRCVAVGPASRGCRDSPLVPVSTETEDKKLALTRANGARSTTGDRLLFGSGRRGRSRLAGCERRFAAAVRRIGSSPDRRDRDLEFRDIATDLRHTRSA